MELKELNHAGEQGVFGSLRVLGDVQSKNIQTIKNDVNVLQNSTVKMNYKLDKYWTNLSDDGIITAPEKLSLKKEWESIVQTHAALLAQVTAKALVSTSYWQDYQDAYEDLYELLYVTEKIFDNMDADTTLSDVESFNTIFNDYYYSEQFVNVAITSGLIDKLGLRGLENLEEEGTEGELAFYRGELYQYHNNAWVRIGTETYLGVLTTHTQQMDEATEGQYFLAGDIFLYENALYVNGEELIVNDEPLMILFYTIVGKIYYFDGIAWEMADDDDPRYVAILADYINLMGKVPLLLEEKIDDVVRDPANGPQYKGVSSTTPSPVKKGDWFVYSGTTVGTTWIKDRIYRYDGEAWELLDPDNDGNSRYYMSALQDILALEEAGDGYFSNLFCNAFFANKASINALKVQTIYLYYTGSIQSQDETYSPESIGLKIDAAGNIDANGDTHLGASTNNKVAIGVPLRNNSGFNTYDVIIGGKTLIDSDTMITGDIDNAIFEVHNVMPAGRTVSYRAGETLIEELEDGTGTYNNQVFTKTHYYEADVPEHTVTYISGYTPVYNSFGQLIRMDPQYSTQVIPASHTLCLYLINGDTYVDRIDNCILEYDLTYTWPMPTASRTFKLKNLPVSRPVESGIVWVDKEGYLRIS